MVAVVIEIEALNLHGAFFLYVITRDTDSGPRHQNCLKGKMNYTVIRSIIRY